jgi:hypothetical protein
MINTERAGDYLQAQSINALLLAGVRGGTKNLSQQSQGNPPNSR